MFLQLLYPSKVHYGVNRVNYFIQLLINSINDQGQYRKIPENKDNTGKYRKTRTTPASCYTVLSPTLDSGQCYIVATCMSTPSSCYTKTSVYTNLMLHCCHCLHKLNLMYTEANDNTNLMLHCQNCLYFTRTHTLYMTL